MSAAAGVILSALLLAAALAPAAGAQGGDESYATARAHMVETQIRARGIKDSRVLKAMGEVPRHLFVPADVRDRAYDDSPLPIGDGQTISQPYIVALMTSLLELHPNDKVLEIGTGSGYQAAVLSHLAAEVYTIEIRPDLAHEAEHRLSDLGYTNVHVRIGDGYGGWPAVAPFDGIVVTAAPPHIPQPLIDQLKVGGRMVVPVGAYFQDLQVITKTAHGLEKKNVIPVRFVPMTGEIQKKKDDGH